MKVIKNSIIYTIVSILQKAIGFLLLPLYTAYLTTQDYGTVSVVTSIESFLVIFFLLSLNGAGTRYYYKYKDEEDKVKMIWGTLFTMVAINTVFFSSLFFIFRRQMLEPFAKGIPFYPYIFLGLISILLNPLYILFQSSLQAKQEGKHYGANNFLFFLVNVTLTVVFLVVFKLKAVAILLALAITNVIFFFYTLIAFVPKIKLGIDKKFAVEALKYSLPLVPHSLSGWAMTMIDRVIINNLRSTASVGVYNIGFQFSNIMNLLAFSVNQAYVPWFFENYEAGEKGRKNIIDFSEMLVLVYSFIALGLCLFVPELLKVMVSEDFRGAWIVVPFLTFAYVFNGIYYMWTNVIFLKKTYFVPIVTISSAAVNVVLNLILIPKYDILGASIASLISMVVMSLVSLIIANSIEKIGFRWGRIYLYAFGFFLLSLSIYWQHPFPWYYALIVKVLGYLLIGGIIFFVKRKTLTGYLKQLFKRQKPANNGG